MDRIERLINLMAALIETQRPLTRDEIRQRVPGYSKDDVASRRAFERDKETLRSMGVELITQDIELETGENGEGYRIPPEKYWLPDPGLTREEIDALGLAASAVKLDDNQTNPLWKLGVSEVGTSDLKVDLDLTDGEKLSQFFAARNELRQVSFDYRGKERTINPYRLSFRNGHWYVNGLDVLSDDVRTYRIDRIEGVLSLSEPAAYESPSPSDQPWLAPWQLGDETPVTVRVLVDSSQADLTVEETGEKVVAKRHDDGAVELELEVTNRDGLRSFVINLLDHAEVLGPPDVRKEFIEYLKELV